MNEENNEASIEDIEVDWSTIAELEGDELHNFIHFANKELRK